MKKKLLDLAALSEVLYFKEKADKNNLTQNDICDFYDFLESKKDEAKNRLIPLYIFLVNKNVPHNFEQIKTDILSINDNSYKAKQAKKIVNDLNSLMKYHKMIIK